MDYSHYSVFNFCAEIYDLIELPFGNSDISSIDMYKFLKSKTNNFDKELFDYLILDIRNFSNAIEFEVKNIDPKPEFNIDESTGYPNYESSELYYNYQEYLVYNIKNLPGLYKTRDDLFSCFDDKTTLRDRISYFKTRPFIVKLCHNINDILQFSDIAEKEYQKTTDREKIKNTPIEKNVELNDFTSREFIEFCFKHEVPNLEMFDYIKIKTENFEIKKVKLFINELKRFSERVLIYVTEEKDFGYEKHIVEICYYLTGYLNSFAIKNIDNPDTISIINDIKTVQDTQNLKLALNTARRINSKIRTSLEYSTYINILYILENNVKDDNITNLSTNKTKSYHDLTLYEFLDVITKIHPVHEIVYTNKENVLDTVSIKGTEEEEGLESKYDDQTLKIRNTLIENLKHDDFYKLPKTPAFIIGTKEIFESGFVRAFIEEYYEEKIHSYYPDKTRLLYVMCSTVEEKHEVTKKQIEIIKNEIHKLGREELSFGYLLSGKTQSERNYKESEENHDFWLSRFAKELQNYTESFCPIYDTICKLNEDLELQKILAANKGEFWNIVHKKKWPKNQNLMLEDLIDLEMELVNQIEYDIEEFKENESWDFDFEEYEKYIEVNRVIEELFNISELFVQLNRLEIFQEFLLIEAETIKNEINLPRHPQNNNSFKNEISLSDFLNNKSDKDKLIQIQKDFKNYKGKSMAILIYLLQEEFKIINIISNSKTHSRKQFIQLFKDDSSFNKYQAINKYLNPYSGELNLSTNNDFDADFITIKEKLTKIIENQVV